MRKRSSRSEGPRSATRNSTWSRCRSPSQGRGRRRRSGRVADERGDHVKDAERLWNPVKTRKRRREGLRGGSVHMNVSSRTTTATWFSKLMKAPRIPCGANPARDVPPAVRSKPARPPGGILYACRYGYMRMQISPSICVVCRCHPQSAWWQTMNTIETIRHRRVLCCSC